MERILRAPDRPSVVFGMNDTMAVGAVKALKDSGLRVPGDMSVIGFEGQTITEHLDPPIATVKIPWVTMGERAAELLLQSLQGDLEQPRQLSVGSELQVRASLGPEKNSH